MYNSNDLRDYSWKEHDGKFIQVWFQGEPFLTLIEIETLEETRTRNVKLKKGDEYVETCEDGEDDIYGFDSGYNEDDDC